MYMILRLYVRIEVCTYRMNRSVCMYEGQRDTYVGMDGIDFCYEIGKYRGRTDANTSRMEKKKSKKSLFPFFLFPYTLHKHGKGMWH
jgi:hypothetical protein